MLGNLTGHPHDYRQTVAPWFRSIFYLHPDTTLIFKAPIGFRPHALAAWTLFAFWPFSRLVHVFSAPSATSPGRTSCTAAGTCSSAPAARVGTRPVKG